MNKKYGQNIFWGIIFLACAFLMFASATHNLVFIGFWSWLFTILIGAGFLKSLFSLDIPASVFCLAFLVIIWREPLGIAHLSLWLILGVALLASVGLSLVFNPFLDKHHRRHPHIIINGKSDEYAQSFDAGFTETTHTSAESDVLVNARMGSTVRYVQSPDFKYANVHVSMGEAKVYFDQAQIQADYATINLEGSMGDIDLYVPRDWDVRLQGNNFLGDIEEKGEKSASPSSIVYLLIHFKLGNVTIHYI